MSKKIFVLLSINFLLLACSLFNKAGELNNIKDVSPTDKEMNTAIQKAQETLPLFLEELNNPASSQSYFSIKGKFPYGENGAAEHIWIDDITYNNGKFTGVLGNEPVYIKGYHLGEPVTVNKENVSDWVIVEENRLFGGFTIHVLVDKMTKDELAKFKAENGFVITGEPLLP